MHGLPLVFEGLEAFELALGAAVKAIMIPAGVTRADKYLGNHE